MEPRFGEREYREILRLTGVSMSREMARRVWMAQQSKAPIVVAELPELSREEFIRWKNAKTEEEAEAIIIGGCTSE